MEYANKIMNVLRTLLPRTTLSIERSKGYVVVIERTWLGRVTRVEMSAKNAVDTDMNLLDLL